MTNDLWLKNVWKKFVLKRFYRECVYASVLRQNDLRQVAYKVASWATRRQWPTDESGGDVVYIKTRIELGRDMGGYDVE